MKTEEEILNQLNAWEACGPPYGSTYETWEQVIKIFKWILDNEV